MKKNIFLAMATSAMMLTTSCSDSFLEVNNPTGEPLEEYYTSEETLEEKYGYDEVSDHLRQKSYFYDMLINDIDYEQPAE